MLRVIRVESCDIVICNKKYIFGLRPFFWRSALKTIGISEVMGMIKVSSVNKMTLEK